MPDLSSTYLGLQLRNPLVASSSPLTQKVDRARRLEDAGIGAIVMHSLFEEEIDYESQELDYFLNRGTHHYAEAPNYYPELEYNNLGPEVYLERVRAIKEAVSVPVIGSLNGISTGGWLEYAHMIEQAGADALELNMYYLPTDPAMTSASLEETYLQLVSAVRAQIKIPLSLKLSPFFTALPYMAQRFAEAGANGLVLFNRFFQPDFDLQELEVVPQHALSTSEDLRLPLRWIAILYGRVNVDFALTSGVHSGIDAIKAVMAGASAVMMASELLANGIGRVREMLTEIEQWMGEHEYESIKQMRGSMSQRSVDQPAAFERAHYIRSLRSFEEHVPL